MSDMKPDHGVQVVKLGEGPKRYVVDEEELGRILLRPDVRDRPVVVVSVAGAYRGGKSFILDFFLRYLHAPRASQLSGEWLGAEDAPLEGFHWRGGGERDTTGIHLWSQPILTTIESTGEKVVVLLMDTQGTFDSESTIGENSTIFALSTLISSVQIYNLSGNIKEDDLQHLQLFTEYGNLARASSDDEKAFQSLIFLVRDWMSDYEHAHGFQGGQTLLNMRLQSKPNQNKELREVREHILTCFETIKGFLMPHPGLAVANKNFCGCLRDVTEKFRLALLEFVPALFDPSNLTPKLINGERVKARDLLEYFKSYVDIFNSDEVPQAVTIFKATAQACLTAAVREARERYEALMDAHLRDEVSVPSSRLRAWHDAALLAACQLYEAKRKLGAQHDIEEHFQNLKKELEGRLSLYMWNNEAKVRDAVTRAKRAYEATVAGACEEQARLCLHPLDLQDLHAEAVQSALTQFDSARDVPHGEKDEERASLVLDFEQHYKHLCAMNEQNNKSAVLEAREKYVKRMKQQVDQLGVSSDTLQSHHRAAMEAARAHFDQHRNRTTSRQDDPFVDSLFEEISSCYAEFEKMNIHSNRAAMKVAEYTYNNFMSSAWGPQSCCFHPQALEDLHERGVEAALEQFQANRPESEDDDFKNNLLSVLEKRYDELQRINEFNNKQAVEQAFGLYTRKMDKHSQPSLVSFLVVPFIVKVLAMLPQYHERSKRAALAEFETRRRGRSYDDDEYYKLLMRKINEAFENYRNPLLALLRELGLPTE